MVIPAGKKLVVMVEGQGKDIFDWHNDKYPNNRVERVPLLVSNDVSINLSSQFSQFLGETGMLSQVSAVFASIKAIRNSIGTGSFKQMGLQTWQKTDPVSLSLEIELNMRNNAKKDVYDPAKLLMKLPLPEETGKLGGLIPPGPSIWSAIQDTTEGAGGDTGGVNSIFDRGNIFSIQVGRTIWIPEVIFKKVVPVFSTEVDENNYPISCKLSIDIDSIYTATTNMVEEFDSNKGIIIKNSVGKINKV